MELLQLKYFQTAARTQNFSQAADLLNISQPSLSITIARLEDELKVNLFDRKGRNVLLNEAGTIFLRRVNAIFSELDNAINEVADIAGEQSRHISLSTTGTPLLSGILKNYIKLHPEVMIKQKCGLLESVEKELVSGVIDFCITLPAIQGENLQCKILKEDEIVLIVPQNHRFAQRESIKLSEAADDYFISLPPNYNFRKVADSICETAGFVPKVLFEIDDILIQEMIELEKGIALLPFYIVNRPHIRKHNLRMIKIEEPDTHIQIGLSWQKNRYLSEKAKQFRNYIIQNYQL
ncbi:LysR family transcriptional regulator [Anaerocolumna sp. MB42-C2]|uniref:LysR family transcriptional regulator n=1 Tax=Anaerocolumna sp. MB42-C2 TaxID=3070997 RepID=UPI0027E092F7|nr:LysR family transcriptional regulator [Anaerocolumna sp. MB42-C2]WMJ86890.1 LysR family transcriptional regulator [Anaerocolumna sp. MB42-C2]